MHVQYVAQRAHAVADAAVVVRRRGHIYVAIYGWVGTPRKTRPDRQAKTYLVNGCPHSSTDSSAGRFLPNRKLISIGNADPTSKADIRCLNGQIVGKLAAIPPDPC